MPDSRAASSNRRVLLVGAATWDVFGSERRPGGAALYGARAAAALRRRARVLTTAAEDADLQALCGHDVTVVPSPSMLTFEHRLEDDERALRLLARPARALAAGDLPSGWADSELLVLGPLLPDDIDMASFASLPAPWRALLAQGLLREMGAEGEVRHATEPTEALLAATDERTSVFLSEEEITDWDERALERLVEAAARVVVTRGRHGADVLRDGERIVIGVSEASSLDTTGSGDVFAVAFMIALSDGFDDADAGQIAAELAAAAVERLGAAELPVASEGAP